MHALPHRQRHAETAADLRQHRDQQNDEIQPAHPGQDTVPEDQGPRCFCPQAGCPRCCKSRYALKKSIHPAKLTRKSIRQHADQPKNEPDRDHEKSSLTHRKLTLVPAAQCIEQYTSRHDKKCRQTEKQRARLMPEQGKRKRNNKCSSADQSRTPQQEE